MRGLWRYGDGGQMRMGGYDFVAGDTQADYAKHSQATFKSILWWTRCKGIEDGWPKEMLKKRLIRIAGVLQRQSEPENCISESQMQRLLYF